MTPITRWTAYEKSALLNKIVTGATTIEQACIDHGLSPEEIDNWAYRYATFGIEGLKSTKLRKV